MLVEFDDNIQINQAIDSSHKDHSKLSYRYNSYDRNLADEFRRSEIENYLESDMLRNDKLFEDLLTTDGNDVTATSERGNLRRKT